MNEIGLRVECPKRRIRKKPRRGIVKVAYLILGIAAYYVFLHFLAGIL